MRLFLPGSDLPLYVQSGLGGLMECACEKTKLDFWRQILAIVTKRGRKCHSDCLAAFGRFFLYPSGTEWGGGPQLAEAQ